MGIQGMEIFAISVVVILFMAVLKQFGVFSSAEPISLEGKFWMQETTPLCLLKLHLQSWRLSNHILASVISCHGYVLS